MTRVDQTGWLVAHGLALALHPAVVFGQVHQAVGQRVAQLGELGDQVMAVFNDPLGLFAGLGELLLDGGRLVHTRLPAVCQGRAQDMGRFAGLGLVLGQGHQHGLFQLRQHMLGQGRPCRGGAVAVRCGRRGRVLRGLWAGCG